MCGTRKGVPCIVNRMAHIDERPRKNGSVTYYVRWIDPDSKGRMTQKMASKESAELLLTVLKAHGSDVDAALKSTKEHFSGVSTVTRMIEDHIDLLTSASCIDHGR